MRDGGSERKIIERLRAGDERALAELVDRHHASFLRVARLFAINDAMAEDVVQETWIAIARGIRGFEGRSRLRTWMFRILVNRAKTRAERDGRLVPFSSLGDVDADPDEIVDAARFDARGMWQAPPSRWDAQTPEDLLLRHEAGAILGEALAGLPERQRIIVVLRDVEGWTSEEVCNVLSIQETNQRVLLHRARTRLRRVLEERLPRRT